MQLNVAVPKTMAAYVARATMTSPPVDTTLM